MKITSIKNGIYRISVHKHDWRENHEVSIVLHKAGTSVMGWYLKEESVEEMLTPPTAMELRYECVLPISGPQLKDYIAVHRNPSNRQVTLTFCWSLTEQVEQLVFDHGHYKMFCKMLKQYIYKETL